MASERNQSSSKPSAPFRLRALLRSTLPLLLSLSTPFMAWKGLSVLTASSYPVMCVISESMAPAFHRGDLIFLWNRPACVQAGDIPVVWFPGNPLPMVHRAIQVYNVDCERKDASSRQLILTKGDNNEVDDVALYPPGQSYVSRDEVVGLVRGFVPYLGWGVIAMQEITWVKYVLFAVISYISIM